MDELPAGATLLRGQYTIEQYLVRGGFGITYLASDSLERQYVIKECFPGALCCRAGGVLKPLSPDMGDKYRSVLRHFLSEARRVAKLDHPNIVGVHQVFEENETAYMAMELVPGEDLLSVIEETPERLSARLINKLLRDALTAVEYIHGLGILHRDISPDNFLLGPDEHLTLIDFGAAREHAGKENRALSALLAVKDGYSPHEFYLTDVDQTAASDLYSLGATFYHLITGEAPPNSQDRVAALAANQPDPYMPLVDSEWEETSELDFTLLQSIDQALEVLPRDRIASAADWVALLNEEATQEQVQAAAPVDKDLTRVISRLVEDTNKNVSQGMPGDAAQMAETRAKKKRARARREADERAKKPKQKVDIFGNPISNVEAWMREQGQGGLRSFKGGFKKSKAGEKTRLLQDPAASQNESMGPDLPEAGEVKQPARRRGLGKLLSSCLPSRRVSATTPVHN
ncbi:MAG: serine/threonine-protein kinase [Arenibacterium sp.]